jgi:hypothetical protein
VQCLASNSDRQMQPCDEKHNQRLMSAGFHGAIHQRSADPFGRIKRAVQ